jgi:hypothetical protein
MLFIPPHGSGEGGPRTKSAFTRVFARYAAVGGALESTLSLTHQNFLHRPRPSTMLRMVPLPRYRGADE